jgi:hypothetical protein
MNFNDGSQRDGVYPVWLEAAIIANRPQPGRSNGWLARLIKALLDDGWWLSLSKLFLVPASTLLFTGFCADLPARQVRL